MSNLIRFVRAAGLALLFLFSPLTLLAAFPWDGPAFSGDPAAMLEAAGKVKIGEEAPYVVLLDDGHFTVESDGSSRSVERFLYRIDDESAVEYMGSVESDWSPWYSQRPKIEARVITKDGTVHLLDQAAVTEAPAGDESTDIFSDGRVVRAPLPAIEVGSIVEYVITTDGRTPIEGAGLSEHFLFGLGVPVNRARLTIDAPLALTPRIVNRTIAKPVVEERNGRRITVWELGPIDAIDDYENSLPPEELGAPYVAFSTGSSWKEIAARYAAIVDRQIAGSTLQKAVRAAIGNATEPQEVVARLLAAIQKDIRYAGVEVGEGSIIPRPPKTVLQNKYGDCKDKATLLVAMLREAGLSAHVVLLRAGFDFDASNDLPGLGMFNHAIVRVENGDAPIWVDPTDPFSRAGELPITDQGRMVLIASNDTTALVRTPEAPSSANLYREVRTFVLPEHGRAKVTEISEYRGAAESSLRRQFIDEEPKQLRENLEGYAKNAYVAKSLERHEHTDPRDLTKPFRLTLEVNESQSGVVEDGDGAVAINLAVLLDLLPNELRNREDAKAEDDPEDAEEPRKNDFFFGTPSVREWSYRIIPPAGYVARTLPPSETKRLGSVTYSQELTAGENGVVQATFRVDSGKRRLTPAEYEETRLAVSRFAKEPTFMLGFDSIGQSKLNEGDVGGALAEYRRLAQLHPKEAQHHIEMARALIAGGLGEAAREEARRAVAIEPGNVEAYRTLAFTLQHDLLGRMYRKGFDLPGAIAARKKAAELDPKRVEVRFEYVQSLEFGTNGQRFGKGASLKEATEAMQTLVKEFEAEGKVYESELTLLYAHTGQYEKLRELGRTLEDKTQRALASAIATVLIEGAPAALRELAQYDVATRRSYAQGIGAAMMPLRRYADVAVMIEAAVQGTPKAADARQGIEMFRKAKRLDAVVAEPKPENVFSQLMLAVVSRDRAALARLLPAEYSRRSTSELLDEFELPDAAAMEGVPFEAAADLFAAVLELRREGDEATGYRVRASAGALADKGVDSLTFYVVREDGRYVLVGGETSFEYIGVLLSEMAERGELDRARTWLNWLREDSKAASADDPLAGDALAAVWPKGKSSATAEEIRLAAAVLVTDEDFLKEGEAVLTALRATSANDATGAQIDHSLAKLYENAKAWPKLLPVTERLVTSHPDSATAFNLHVKALLHNGKGSEAVKLAEERLARMPNDVDAMRALGTSAASARDYAAAQGHATKLVDALRPSDGDYKMAAWYALFTGSELDRALQFAERGSKAAEKDERAASLRTLAALLAENGKNVEARQTLLSGMDAAMKSEPTAMDWYVLGRIAENYGVTDAAIAAYKRVPKEAGGATTFELAERRLARLVKK